MVATLSSDAASRISVNSPNWKTAIRASLTLGATTHRDVNQPAALDRSFTRQCTCEIVTVCALLNEARWFSSPGDETARASVSDTQRSRIILQLPRHRA